MKLPELLIPALFVPSPFSALATCYKLSRAARTLLGISGMKHVLYTLVGSGASPWAPSTRSTGTPAPFHTAGGS